MSGATVWLTGLPSAGKSTIAQSVAELLRVDGRCSQILDGDDVRAELCTDLGFSRADRETNVRRIGWVARLLASHDVIVLVPVIAPYAAGRDRVRAQHDRVDLPFVEVHVDTPIHECVRRDVKGLYARQREGTVVNLTGVDDPYEAPRRPELRVRTLGRSSADCAADVVAVLDRLGIGAGCPGDRPARRPPRPPSPPQPLR